MWIAPVCFLTIWLGGGFIYASLEFYLSGREADGPYWSEIFFLLILFWFIDLIAKFGTMWAKLLSKISHYKEKKRIKEMEMLKLQFKILNLSKQELEIARRDHLYYDDDFNRRVKQHNATRKALIEQCDKLGIGYTKA